MSGMNWLQATLSRWHEWEVMASSKFSRYCSSLWHHIVSREIRRTEVDWFVGFISIQSRSESHGPSVFNSCHSRHCHTSSGGSWKRNCRSRSRTWQAWSLVVTATVITIRSVFGPINSLKRAGCLHWILWWVIQRQLWQIYNSLRSSNIRHWLYNGVHLLPTFIHSRSLVHSFSHYFSATLHCRLHWNSFGSRLPWCQLFDYTGHRRKSFRSGLVHSRKTLLQSIFCDTPTFNRLHNSKTFAPSVSFVSDPFERFFTPFLKHVAATTTRTSQVPHNFRTHTGSHDVVFTSFVVAKVNFKVGCFHYSMSSTLRIEHSILLLLLSSVLQILRLQQQVFRIRRKRYSMIDVFSSHYNKSKKWQWLPPLSLEPLDKVNAFPSIQSIFATVFSWYGRFC